MAGRFGGHGYRSQRRHRRLSERRDCPSPELLFGDQTAIWRSAYLLLQTPAHHTDHPLYDHHKKSRYSGIWAVGGYRQGRPILLHGSNAYSSHNVLGVHGDALSHANPKLLDWVRLAVPTFVDRSRPATANQMP